MSEPKELEVLDLDEQGVAHQSALIGPRLRAGRMADAREPHQIDRRSQQLRSDAREERVNGSIGHHDVQRPGEELVERRLDDRVSAERCEAPVAAKGARG